MVKWRHELPVRIVAVAGCGWNASWASPLDVLLVINALENNRQPLAIAANLSPESDPNGNGVVLLSQVTVVGQALPGASVRIDVAADSNEASSRLGETGLQTADAMGRFHFTVDLSPGLNTLRVEVSNVLGESLAVERAVRHGDVILDWNASLLGVIRDWNRTFPAFLPPLLTQWPNVTPFAMTSGSQFRPDPPPALDSAEYAAAVDEVMQLGGLNSSARTAEQTEIALFWADGGGTSTPPGHWNQIAVDVALARGNTLAENARLFALLNIAQADAGIASWDAKYVYDSWRPIDAIRRGGSDGNDATIEDPTWTPLIITPPFPSYTSGHSTFSGAAEAVLSSCFGSNVQFTSQSDGHSGFTQRPLSASQIVTRTFTSFAQAADESSRSRIYGGIHFEFDNTAGLAAGRAVGSYVMGNFLTPRLRQNGTGSERTSVFARISRSCEVPVPIFSQPRRVPTKAKGFDKRIRCCRPPTGLHFSR